jgi:hypothetical protein
MKISRGGGVAVMWQVGDMVAAAALWWGYCGGGGGVGMPYRARATCRMLQA